MLAHRFCFQASKAFTEAPPLRLMAEEIRRQIDEFKPTMPVVTALRNPGLKVLFPPLPVRALHSPCRRRIEEQHHMEDNFASFF
jgi:hypothetical protein